MMRRIYRAPGPEANRVSLGEVIVIVRPAADGGVHLITQPDHARLAGRIMRHCPALRASPRAERILLAIAEHDNGWEAVDAAPLLDPGTGEILDFVNAPLGVRHDVWPRAVTRLSADPWAAALVAQHAITVYDRYRSDAAWTSFFARMRDERDAMLRAAASGHLDDLERDYAWVRLGDLVSLTFCTGWRDEQRFGGWTVRLEGTRVRVTPDPFEGKEIGFGVRARPLRAHVYRSTVEFEHALRDAQPLELEGTAGA